MAARELVCEELVAQLVGQLVGQLVRLAEERVMHLCTNEYPSTHQVYMKALHYHSFASGDAQHPS